MIQEPLFVLLLLHLSAFMIGSIPIGYIIARAKGVDIRTEGSGNVGATNVNRVLGASAGVYTLVGDICKGLLGVSLVYLLSQTQYQVPQHIGFTTESFAPSVGFFTILGHCFSPFLKFKGGKGVATSLGVFLLVCPLYLLAAVGLFAILVKATRYVSLGSLSAALILPVLVLMFEGSQNPILLLSTLLTAALVVFRHIGNIKRLLNGTESKLKIKKKEDAEARQSA